MGFWGEEMPNVFCREVLLSVCQILCTPWAIPATNSPLFVSNQDALQKPSFPGWQRTITRNYMLYTSETSLGFEVTHEQLTAPPPSMKMGSKGGARGEVSKQGSGQGSRWCPGYPPGLPFSAQWETSSVVVFTPVSWDPSMHHWVSHNHSQGQGERCLAWKKPLWFSHFSVHIYRDWVSVC